MSAPLRLTPGQVRALGDALDHFTVATRNTGVLLTAYGPVDVAIGGCTIRVSWDEDARQYVIDDRNGG
ncbi:MAG: hypothetical protein HOV66_07630 [Streptomycetaceae bacterium]|nr:hypothetical protein [Streptomycetaceae bacterium]